MQKNNICKFSEIKSSDLICTEFVYETENAQSKKTYADRYVLGFAVSGEGVFHLDRSEFKITKGTVFFVEKETHFSIEGKEGFAYFYISFYGRRAEELVERFALSSERCVFDLADSYDELYGFCSCCLHRANEHNTDIISECGLLYLLTYLEARESKKQDLLSAIVMLTSQNFSDVKFSLGTLAKMMNYDAKYLSFYFKKHKKICYSEYLRDLRIKHAVFLMERGITSIKNIALLSGFADALYFSKVFKKKYGKEPEGIYSLKDAKRIKAVNKNAYRTELLLDRRFFYSLITSEPSATMIFASPPSE